MGSTIVSHPLPDPDTLDEYLFHQIPPISNQGIHPTHKEFHLYDYLHSQEKKEEGLRGEWVGVSIGFPFGGLGKPNIYHESGVFYKNWEDCGGSVRVINIYTSLDYG